MSEPYYEATPEREYTTVCHKPIDTIHLEVGKPRIRITLDETKWKVASHLADSGSIVAILISPKKGEEEGRIEK